MKGYILFFTVLFTLNQAFTQPLISIGSEGFQVDNVLRFDIDFSTSEDGMGYVCFYHVSDGDTIREYTSLTDPSSDHFVSLIGLLPETTYKYTIFAFNETSSSSTEEMEFTTDVYPAGLPFIDSIEVLTDSLAGYIFVNADRSSISESDALTAYNGYGVPVWYEQETGSEDDIPCHSYKLTDSRTLLFTDCFDIRETNLDGSLVNQVLLSEEDNWYNHHEVFTNSDGNYVSLGIREQIVDLSSIGGPIDATVLGNGLYEVDPDGDILFEWSVFDEYDTLDIVSDTSYWSDKFGSDSYTWRHATSLYQDVDDNYIISFPFQNQVVKINNTSGLKLWALGDDGDIDILPAEVFAHQQDISKGSGFTYFMMDNQGLDSLSRAVEFFIDFGYSTPMMMITWQHAFPVHMFSASKGSVERQENGNSILSLGETGNIREVDELGEVVWHMRQNEPFDRVQFLDKFYDLPNKPEFFMNMEDLCAGETLLLKKLVQPQGGYFESEFVVEGVFTATLEPGETMMTYPVVYHYGWMADTIYILVEDCTTGINAPENSVTSVNLFPNPASDSFSADLNLLKQGEVEIVLTDLQGRIISELFKGDLPSGMNQLKLTFPSTGITSNFYEVQFRFEDQILAKPILKID